MDRLAWLWTPELAFLGVALAAGSIATIVNARRGVIPNWLTLPIPLLAILAGVSVGDPWTHSIGLGAALVVGLLAFWRGAPGGAVKLSFGLGALLGWHAVLVVSLSVLVVAGAQYLRRRELEPVALALPMTIGALLAGLLDLALPWL